MTIIYEINYITWLFYVHVKGFGNYGEYMFIKNIYVLAKRSIANCLFNHKMRKKLKNHNFTILSSNCMGGIIYHRLNEKFYSPTINLWMYEPDFQKFCLNLNYYKNSSLRFVDGKKKYPVAILGEEDKEITIFFLHYQSKEEAKNKWNERIKRIDEDNLYVIATDNDGISKNDLERWKEMKCKNKVVFVANQCTDLDYAYLLKKYEGKESVGKYVNDINQSTGIRYVEEEFDFVDFLNKQANEACLGKELCK